MDIPEEAYYICQRSGTWRGLLEPGRNLVSPFTRIIFVVTKRAITYDHNVVNCVTKDNVNAQVGITFVFRIVDPCTFCAKIGATNFNELLVTTCEEQIRTLVRSVYHTSVYELRSASTESLLRLMNQIFQKFGVEFLSTTVKSISIPETIAKTYEADTKHGTAITHEIKFGEFKKGIKANKEEIECEQYKLNHEKKTQKLLDQQKAISISSATRLANAKQDLDRELIAVRASCDEKIARAKAAMQEEIAKAKSEAKTKLAQANAEKLSRIKMIDEWQAEELKKSESDILCESNKLEAVKKLAAAKEDINMKNERKQEVSLARIKTLSKFAEEGNYVLFENTDENSCQRNKAKETKIERTFQF